MSEKNQESFFDDTEEGSFSYEFEEVPEPNRLLKNIIKALVGLLFVVFLLVVIIGVASEQDCDDASNARLLSESEREWCVENAPSKAELQRCLKDPNYQPPP